MTHANGKLFAEVPQAFQSMKPPPNLAPMLAALAGMGAGRDLVVMLIEFAGIKLPLDERRFLMGPIIVDNSSGWHEVMPRWMPLQVQAERVEIALGEAAWPVGPTEIAAVMYAAVMAAPMSGETVDLYCWATANACARHYGKPVAEYWDKLVSGPRSIEDREVVKPGGRLFETYRELAGEIRRKVIAAQAMRDKSAFKMGKTITPIEPEAPLLEVQSFNF
jgi:hypothetical protein